MKNHHRILIAFVLSFLLPGFLLKFAQIPQQNQANDLTVSVLSGATVEQIEMEEYIVGVLLAEMLPDFHCEAIKAQAVAARTFTAYRLERNTKHHNADVCTSANCCQGYIDPDEYLAKGGSKETVQKMRDAVSATSGQIVCYNGAPIDATYFSSSGGRTEDAQAVWGTWVPYLQSVESNEQVDYVTKEIDNEAFCSALGLSSGSIYIEPPSYTKGGGIAEIRINGKVFTGNQLRQFLELRSTLISFSVDKDSVRILTNGNGHRVGMSQYGADTLASKGYGYKQILSHYYTSTEIKTVQPDDN